MSSILSVGLCLALVGGSTGDPPETPAARENCVRLLTDFHEPQLIARLRGLLSDAVPIFERATGHRLPQGEQLIINLYSTLRGYQRGARSAGVSGFMNVGAVTAWSNQESFLALQPRRDPAYLEAAGWLPDLTAQLALHEAAHQFMARSDMYPTLALPPWYSEGVADHLAELALRELVFGEGRPCLMLEDARRSVVDAAAAQRTIPLRELFTLAPIDLDAHASRDLFYDQSSTLVSFLVGEGKDRWGAIFQRYLDELDREDRSRPTMEFLARRAGHRDRWLELVADLPALEEEWRRGLAGTDTPWIERSGSSQWVGDDLLTAALDWQESGFVESRVRGPESAVRFECEFDPLDRDGGQAFVVLHAPTGDEGGLKLNLDLEGTLQLVGWRGTNTSVIGVRAPELIASEGFVRLRIDVDGRRLVVRIADGEPRELETPEGFPAPGGAWGLGAWKCAVLWRGVELE